MSGTTSGVEFALNRKNVDMTVYPGKTINFELIWGGAAPVDVTGYGVLMQIRDMAGALMLELSTANGKVAVGGADGKITFIGTVADTRAVTKAGRYEIELTTPAGDVYRALSAAVMDDYEVAL